MLKRTYIKGLKNFFIMNLYFRFREIYYWDTYWILRGLLVSNMLDTARLVYWILRGLPVSNMLDTARLVHWILDTERSTSI